MKKSEEEEVYGISFRNLCYSINGKSILHQVWGDVPPCNLLAIMGPTGSGKTTLLDILAGRNKVGEVSGSILVNNYSRPHNFKQISAYVMQDEALIGNLTVFETLMFSASLRVRSSYSERLVLVNKVIKLLNLQKISNSRNLRNGECRLMQVQGRDSIIKRYIWRRKKKVRLMIGVEMMTSPKILFLDEPTSGLDSRNAFQVMKALLNLCSKENCTVICTIHQPRSNIFHMFDRLLLMSEGKCVYFGGAKQSVEYFRSIGYPCESYTNPADFLLDLLEEDVEDDGEKEPQYSPTVGVSIETPSGFSLPGDMVRVDLNESITTKLAEAFKQSELHINLTKKFHNSKILEWNEEVINNASMNASGHSYSVGYWRQLFVLFLRTWKYTVRDAGTMYVRPVAAMMIALLVGSIYFQQEDSKSSSHNRINTILFLMCVFSLFCLPAIGRFIEERLLFTREHASGYYRASTYFLATFAVEFPILIAIVIGYGSISYWMVGLQPTLEHFGFFVLVIFLVINVGFSVSQVISAAVTSTNMAIAIYMVVLVYSLLMGGFIVSKADLPSGMKWAVQTSYFYYGFESLCVNEFQDKSYGQDVLDNMGFEIQNKFYDVYVLSLLFIALRIIAYFM